MVDQDRLKSATAVCEKAQSGEVLEAFVVAVNTRFLRVHGGRPERISQATEGFVAIRSIKEGRCGLAYGEDLREEGLTRCLENARAIREATDPDPFIELPAEEVPSSCDETLGELPSSAKERLALALELEQRTLRRGCKAVEQATLSEVNREVVIVNSLGIHHRYVTRHAYAFINAIFEDGPNSYSVSEVEAGATMDDLNFERLVETVAQRGRLMAGARRPATASLTAVFDYDIGAMFLRSLSYAFSGEALAFNRSFLARRLGEQVAHPGLSLFEDPTDPGAWDYAPVDDEGEHTRRVELVAQGVMTSFLNNRTFARRTGLHSTASALRPSYAASPVPGARALSARAGNMSASQIIESVDRGVFVTSVSGWHSGVNPVSGDFSVGIEGFLIKGGALAEPVREAVLASTMQRMLQRLAAASVDKRLVPGAAWGQVLAIEEMVLSGS